MHGAALQCLAGWFVGWLVAEAPQCVDDHVHVHVLCGGVASDLVLCGFVTHVCVCDV